MQNRFAFFGEVKCEQIIFNFNILYDILGEISIRRSTFRRDFRQNFVFRLCKRKKRVVDTQTKRVHGSKIQRLVAF